MTTPTWTVVYYMTGDPDAYYSGPYSEQANAVGWCDQLATDPDVRRVELWENHLVHAADTAR